MNREGYGMKQPQSTSKYYLAFICKGKGKLGTYFNHDSQVPAEIRVVCLQNTSQKHTAWANMLSTY